MTSGTTPANPAAATAPAPTRAPHGRRALLTLAGLLAVTLAAPLWVAITQFVGLCGLIDSEPSARWAPAVPSGSSLAAGLWLLRILRAHTTRWRTYLALPLITTACLTPLLPSEAGGAVFNLSFVALAGWLTLAVLHQQGIPPRQVLSSRRPRASLDQRFWAWSTSMTGLIGAAWLSVRAGNVLIDHLPGLLPSMTTTQDDVLGHTKGLLYPLTNFVYTSVLEELVIVGAVTVLARTAGRSLWAVYAFSVGMRVAVHLYMGVPAIAMAVLGAACLFLYLRYQRLLSLLLAHLYFDTLGFLYSAP
ncbi:type II CAAX prenyl endopeptidase Rce1 family protein [Streptomyces roseifaciens]|uniref:CPBP family glutamic-type intramembrane protease n=1 Tax=Streptomyces roseifaciens TaxID=1488406 RepID=UPI000AD87F53|nr:CPBP family glutamic-type intramembrane protease [Streptomyces roseifaciens]